MCNRCEGGVVSWDISKVLARFERPFWPDSELLPMNLTVGREMNLLQIKIMLSGKRCPSKKPLHEMYTNLHVKHRMSTQNLRIVVGKHK